MYFPYKVLLNEKDGYYYFHTKHGIEYRCFFTQNESGNNIISLNLTSEVFYFDLVRFTHCTSSKFDRNISATVGEIINQFFDKNPDSIISYVCDNSDSKGNKRQFSFSKWLKLFNHDPKKSLIKGSVLDYFFAGSVLLDSHPEKDKIYNYFESELKTLKDETDKSGEVLLL